MRWERSAGSGWFAFGMPDSNHPSNYEARTWRFQWGRGPRRRSAAYKVGLPQRPADILVLIVARGCVKQFSCRFTQFTASAVPKAVLLPCCGPSNRTPCMPVARTDDSMPRQQRHPLSPPGCFRIRLRIPPSLSWRNIGACRPPGWRNRRVVARISSSDARFARGQPSPFIC